MSKPPRICRDCPAEIHRRSKSGLCRYCIGRDPEAIAKRVEASRRAYILRPEILDRARERLLAATKTPEHAERARKMMKTHRLWERGIEVCGPSGSPSRKQMARTLSSTRLRHIPPERREEYRHLVNNKKFPAAEAARIVLDQHQVEMTRFRSNIAPELAVTSKVDIPAELPHDIVDAVATVLRVDRRRILSHSRKAELVDARSVIVRVLRAEEFSFPVIGKVLDRDHTSIIHLHRTFDQRAAALPILRDVANALTEARAA